MKTTTASPSFALEVDKYVLQTRPTKDPEMCARYTGGIGHEQRKPDEQSKLRFAGLSLPQIHLLSKRKFSFTGHPKEFSIWLGIFANSKQFETRGIALKWIKRQTSDERAAHAKSIASLVPEADNWALSDELSFLCADLLESKALTQSQYEKWNRSKNPWERRQSVVGILNYSYQRKIVPPTKWILKMVESRLEDPHFYVQKGVGWCLRELDRVDSKAQRQFVKANVHRIPPAGWFAASELYSKKMRDELVELRRFRRSKRG